MPRPPHKVIKSPTFDRHYTSNNTSAKRNPTDSSKEFTAALSRVLDMEESMRVTTAARQRAARPTVTETHAATSAKDQLQQTVRELSNTQAYLAEVSEELELLKDELSSQPKVTYSSSLAYVLFNAREVGVQVKVTTL